ncbi:MAG: hypothetical protein J3R72DRAFT_448273 [Linnemannia gamsii]|nr:MAG: hypothetical protein J3R72DRAFT_448273 [Linnemannia gamsii]
MHSRGRQPAPRRRPAYSSSTSTSSSSSFSSPSSLTSSFSFSTRDTPLARTTFTIPELIQSIAQFLAPKDQVQLSMTNRLLHQTITPLFWLYLDLRDGDATKKFLFSTDAHRALEKNIHRLRHLDIDVTALVHIVDGLVRPLNNNDSDNDNDSGQPTTTTTTHLTSREISPTTLPTPPLRLVPTWLPLPQLKYPFSLALPRTTRLTSLNYSRGFSGLNVSIFTERPHTRCRSRSPTEQDELEDKHKRQGPLEIAWMLDLNPTLTHLHLDNYHIVSPFALLVFLQSLSAMRYLQELYLQIDMCSVAWEDVSREVLGHLPVSLETAHLGHMGTCYNGGNLRLLPETMEMAMAGKTVVRRQGAMTRLRILHYDFNAWSGLQLLCSFIEYCPALETFYPPFKCNHLEQFALLGKSVVKHCLRLRNLDNCNQIAMLIVRDLAENTLERVFNQYMGQGHFINSICKIISIKHFKSIRKIQIVNSEHLKGSIVRDLLASCQTLEYFSIEKNSPSIRLRHLVEKEWACHGLKHLDITVDMGKRRHNSFSPTRDRLSLPPLDDMTMKMLEKFYRQLGTLTEIQVLHLRIRTLEMQWLDKSGYIRKATDATPEFTNPDNKDIEDDDGWSSNDDERVSSNRDRLPTSYNTPRVTPHQFDDPSFPGLLSLGCYSTNRPGFLNYLSGLKNLRELRGHVQATTIETCNTVGVRELQWMLEHWPQLRVIELLPSFDLVGDGGCGGMMHGLHIEWLQKQRPDICIKKKLGTNY